VSVFELPLHFLRPWWWLALLPLPLALWMLARNGGGRAALAKLADAALLPHLVSSNGARRRLALGLVASAWLLAVAALSGPAWQKIAAPLYVNGAARVVVLSLSDDMLAQDMQPDRMTRARFAVRDLLNDAGDARMALVAYAGAAFTVAPLTDDKNTILNLLQALKPDVMPVPGNDAAAGIRQGVELLQQAHAKGGEIVLVTGTADAAAVAQAKTARAKGVRVDVLGVGTREGAPVPKQGGGFASGSGGTLMARRDDAALRAVANAGGGRYVVLQADGAGASAFGAPVAEAGHASHRACAVVARRWHLVASRFADPRGAGIPARLAAGAVGACAADRHAGCTRVHVGFVVGEPRTARVAGITARRHHAGGQTCIDTGHAWCR